jgi:hypothetical protein
MGSKNTKNIEYNSFTSEEQTKMLEDFKLTYADKSKKELRLEKTICNPNEYIAYSNNYKIKFKNEVDLIDFVSDIGRPFVITYFDNTYSIHFVYGKNLK